MARRPKRKVRRPKFIVSARFSIEQRMEWINRVLDEVKSYLSPQGSKKLSIWFGEASKFIDEQKIRETYKIQIKTGIACIIAKVFLDVSHIELSQYFPSAGTVITSIYNGRRFLRSHPEILEKMKEHPELIMLLVQTKNFLQKTSRK